MGGREEEQTMAFGSEQRQADGQKRSLHKTKARVSAAVSNLTPKAFLPISRHEEFKPIFSVVYPRELAPLYAYFCIRFVF